jgi:tRNA1(Val) A37 N6-methylase TrmN6
MAGKPAEELTDDAALGGRLHLLQPRRGHRFGHDAILLAAATPVRSGERVADLGAGVGAAGLALACRVPGARVTLVEIDARLAALAQENASRNGFAASVDAVTLDVAAAAADFAAAGLASTSCDVVLMNPPFHDSALPTSPDPRRRAAHSLEAANLVDWVAAAERLLRPGGILTLIFRADGLPMLLGLLAGRFGAIALLPVHPKPGAAAIRVLLGAIKASRGALAIWPGLVLAAADGTPSPQAEAVLRHGAEVALIERRS